MQSSNERGPPLSHLTLGIYDTTKIRTGGINITYMIDYERVRDGINETCVWPACNCCGGAQVHVFQITCDTGNVLSVAET